MSNEAKQKSLTLLDDQIVEGFNEQALETKSLGIYDLFHFIDLNNDRQDDVVFNGFGGASDEFVMVFLKNQAGYAKAFHDYGHITNLKIDSETMFYIKRPEMVGEESGDSLVIFKVEGIR